MKRKIITIDEEKCNGCGVCIPDCPEGALQVIDGKARLVSDLFCDGLGACIKTCPMDAMHIEEREAEPYDEKKVMANVVSQGENVIKAHLEHLKEHNETELYELAVQYLEENKIEVKGLAAAKAEPMACGCPGTMARSFDAPSSGNETEQTSGSVKSELRQWPVQLKLLNPMAPYFNNADLLIAADCVPFAYGNFHQRFVKDRVIIMFCPKLDPYIEEYIDKITAILKNNTIKSITVAHMEVPCCGGIIHVLEEAMKKSGKNIMIKDYTISVQGDII